MHYALIATTLFNLKKIRYNNMALEKIDVRRFQSFSRWRHFPGILLTALSLAIWIWIHNDYGITWDETSQTAYGEALWKFLFVTHDFSSFNHSKVPSNLFYYGPLLPLVTATFAHALHADIFVVCHAIQGLIWVAMVFPVCALGWQLAGNLGAWFSGVTLLGTPTLWGHAFNNPKDLPLACAAIWLLYAAVSIAVVRRLNWRHAVQLGIAIWFLLSMRPGAWFLCALLGLVPLAAVLRTHRRRLPQAWLLTAMRTGPYLFGAFALGWILTVLPWPSAWQSPFLFPIKSAVYAAHFDEVHGVLFNGSILLSNHLPWYYLLGYLAVTLPVPLLILTLWGQQVFIYKAKGCTSRLIAVLGVMFVFWFPVAMFLLMRPNIYDGVRHFLFIQPAFALFAGVAAATLIRSMRRLPAHLTVVGMLLLLASAVPDMVRLHPYESVFFNCLAGQRNTLSSRYETDYWLSSYREAALWLNQVAANHPSLSVTAAIDDSCFPVMTHFLDPRIKLVGYGFGRYPDLSLPSDVDYYVATTRFQQDRNFYRAPLVHTIERDGIVLTVIRENRHQ